MGRNCVESNGKEDMKEEVMKNEEGMGDVEGSADIGAAAALADASAGRFCKSCDCHKCNYYFIVISNML